MPLYLMTPNSHHLVPDKIYSSYFLCASSVASAPAMVQQCQAISNKLFKLAIRQMEKNHMTQDILEDYSRNFCHDNYELKSKWCGHTWFTFSPWSSLVNSIKMKYKTGIATSNLKEVDDLQFTNMYPTLSKSWINPKETKRFKRVAFIGDHSATMAFVSNPDISYFNIKLSTDWVPSILEKAYSLPSNSLFMVLLDVSMVTNSIEHELCTKQKCREKLSIYTLPVEASDNVQLNKLMADKMKIIMDKLTLMRYHIPNQSTISLAPVPAERVLVINSLESLVALNHDDLHKHLTGSTVIGRQSSIFIGKEEQWKKVYRAFLTEVQSMGNNLVINFNRTLNNASGFTCNASLLCVSEAALQSTEFPEIIDWKKTVMKHIITHLNNTFPLPSGQCCAHLNITVF